MPYERQQLFQPVSVPNGNVAYHSALANALEDFNSTVERVGGPIVADLGTRAGLEAGAKKEGTTKLPIGPYNRAYNDSFVRAYTLSAYADSEQDFMRLEADAKGDPIQFKAVAEKRRDAVIAEALPAAQPFLRASIDERIAQGGARLQQDAIVRSEQERAAQTLKGLGAIQRDTSRALTSGTPEGLQKGTAMGLTYMGLIDQAVQDRIFTPIEGQKMIDAAVRKTAVDVNLGRLNSALTSPGGNPVAVIQGVLTEDNPAFSDDDRQALADEMLHRLNQSQAMERARLEEAGLLEADVFDRNYSEGMDLAIAGTLSTGWIRQRLQNGTIKPENAHVLVGMMNSPDVSKSDPDVIRDLIIKGQEVTVEDIAVASASGGLSKADRNGLLKSITTQKDNWLTSPEYRAGKETLASAAGVSLENIGLASTEKKNALSEALLAYEQKMYSIPAEERVGKAREVALSVVGIVTRNSLSGQIEENRKLISSAKPRAMKTAGVDTWEDVPESVQKTVESRIDRYEKQIKDWEALRAKP